ncbi:iron complex transport system permease protein [Kineococcus xinjiangensis]|uniref:Iron complex transport system permease protein n=1 Tax=Kineococcus xinjiangensis TaxID=512762 RepID=A0A2S6IWT4_9ACTN|nr:iron chelate uptake ABC transporter family permease subunit [Kineococcus xinjiangensis]PPK98700.1 iron complex transport system permease protein [Kineococcus xinjiangensis]
MSAPTATRPRPAPPARRRAARRTRSTLVCLALTAVILGAAVLALTTGEFPLPPADVVATLLGRGDGGAEFIVLGLRLPRLVTAIAVGAALAVAGGLFQQLTRNPLGSPDVVGFNEGAALGALVVLLLLGWSGPTVVLGALAGGLGTAVLVWLLALRGGASGYRLVLVGIGLAAMLQAGIHYLLTRAKIEDAMGAHLWLTGSLNGRGWEHVAPLAAGMVVLVPAALLVGRHLTLLEMGDDLAAALGVRVQLVQASAVLVAVALTAGATTAAGPVLFVALAAPQIARRLTRTPGSGLVAAALTGSALLLLADVAAQRVIAPAQLPVGVMTGAVGGAYLAWLLVGQWRRGRG